MSAWIACGVSCRRANGVAMFDGGEILLSDRKGTRARTSEINRGMTSLIWYAEKPSSSASTGAHKIKLGTCGSVQYFRKPEFQYRDWTCA